MKKLFIIFPLIFFFNLHCAKIVFDLGGVLLSQMSIRAMPTIIYNLGWFHILNFCLHNGFINPQNRIFEFADHVYGEPESYNLWLQSDISSQEFYDTLKEGIEKEENYSFFKNDSERRIIKGGLKFIMPDKLTKITYTYRQGRKTVQKCLDNGHEVYVLSNWDNESFPRVYNKCIKCFKLFPEKNLCISSYVKHCKPSPEIFKIILKNDDPSEFYLIDDNKENITTAKELGMHIIEHVNWESTNLKLKNFGLIKRKIKKFYK